MSDDEADAAGAAAADAYAAEFAADDDYDESIFAKKAPEPPSEAVLKSKAREIIAESDRDKVTYRMVRNMLEERLSLPEDGLKPRKKEINAIVDAIIAEDVDMQDAAEEAALQGVLCALETNDGHQRVGSRGEGGHKVPCYKNQAETLRIRDRLVIIVPNQLDVLLHRSFACAIRTWFLITSVRPGSNGPNYNFLPQQRDERGHETVGRPVSR